MQRIASYTVRLVATVLRPGQIWNRDANRTTSGVIFRVRARLIGDTKCHPHCDLPSNLKELSSGGDERPFTDEMDGKRHM